MLSSRIYLLRNTFNLTQKQLGDKLGFSKQTVSNWETNNLRPTIDTLELLADLFGVSTDYLLGREDNLYINATDLTIEEVAHIQQVVNDLRRGRKNEKN